MEILLLSIVALLLGALGLGIAFVAGTFIGLFYGRYYYDDSENSGTRNWPGLRRSCLWNPMRSYFSFRCESLDAHLIENRSRAVIYACRPHGLFAISCFLAFAAHPKSRVRCAVHRLIFWTPLLRDFAVWMGSFDATRDNIHAALSRSESIALVPGGVREMVQGADHRRHRGFLRIAYDEKVPVVCVYFGGEDRLFWTWQMLRGLREAFIDFMGYPFPSFFFGPLPRPLTTLASKTALQPLDYPNCDDFTRAFDTEMKRLSSTAAQL
jgi:1-acyl-sn-glycerol-3-phosphate acyltransferase